MNCRICNSSEVVNVYELYDDRYGYPGVFQLLKCKRCGHGFLENNFSPEQLTQLYTNYYPRSTFSLDDHKPYQEVKGLKAWLDGEYSSPFRWVPHNVRVLDIGCGYGESLGYYRSRGCDAYGVEADENIRRVAERYGYKVEVGLFDPQKFEPDFFDYVTMGQVIEHMRDTLKTLEGIARILKPGGVAILSTPNANGWGARVYGRKWINWHAPYHIQFFSVKSMKIAAEKAGLVLEQSKTITHSEWLHYQRVHLILYPEIGEPSSFWSPKSQGVRTPGQELMLNAVFRLRKYKINHLITRFFDLAGMGDNYLFFLRKKGNG